MSPEPHNPRKEVAMGKPKIGIDLDDVIVDTFPLFLKHANEAHGESFKVQDFTTHRYQDVWRITKAERLQRFIAFDNSPLKMQTPLLPEARKAIMIMQHSHELHIITARPEDIAEGTRALVDQLFPPYVFTDIHFCSKDNGATYARPKQQVCKELGVVVHIEDHPETATTCAEHGIRTLLFDQPWNRGITLHENMERVRDWDDVIRALFETLLLA